MTRDELGEGLKNIINVPLPSVPSRIAEDCPTAMHMPGKGYDMVS